MLSARWIALLLLMLSGCATAPPPPPPARTAQRTQAPPATQQRPEIVPAQVFIAAEPITVPPEVVVPRTVVAPPETAVVPAPSLPGPVPLILVPEPEANAPKREAPPESNVHGSKPAPVVVKPEPKGPEKVPEEASRKRIDRPPRPNHVEVADEDWQPAPGHPRYKPCSFLSYGGGPHGSEKLPPVWIRCSYRCGKYLVELFDVRGISGDECKKWANLRRAEEQARVFDGLSGKGR